MITKKLKGKTFVWNPNAFNGKGYWFALGKNGSYGLAASKREAGYLNRPSNNQIKSNSPEPEGETPQKEISDNTQKSLGKLKDKFSAKNLKNMFKPFGQKMTEGMTGEKDQTEIFGKSKSPVITPKKIGNIDTAFYTKTASTRVMNIKRGDSIADVSSKILALIDKTYQEKKLKRELARNFEKEKQEEEKRRHEKLIKEIYKSKGMKVPKKSSTSKTQDKLDKGILDKIKHIKIEKAVKTKTPTAPTEPTVPTAAKVGLGVVGTVVAGNVLAKIGGSEGTYTTLNRVKGEGSSYDVVQGKATATGGTYQKSLTDMTIKEVIDLGNQRAAFFKQGGGGSAAGKYQFMPKTLEAQAKQVFGKDWENTRFSPENQDKLAQNLLNYEIDQLKRNGVPVSEAGIYMVHFIGNGGAAKQILDPSNNDKKMSDLFPNLKGSNNDKIANMKVSEYKKTLSDKGFSFGPMEEKQQGTVTATKISPGTDIKKGDYGIESHGTMKKVGGLVFHHTGGNSLKVAIATMQQKSHGGNQYAAQFTIDRDGTIYQLTKNETDIVYHAGTDSSKGAKVTNWNAIGVEIVSSDSEHFTAEQISAGVSLGKYLQDKYGISNNMIFGHGEIAAMPGGSHNKMPTEGLVVAQTLREGRAVPMASPSSTGTQVASVSSENKDLKNASKPVVAINNSKNVTQAGNKPNQRVLIAQNKPDLPAFIQETIQLR